VKPSEELKVLFRRHRWAFEEMVYDQKTQEANTLASGGGNAMFAYLKDCFGTSDAVLESLRDMVVRQKRRLKSLHMRSPVK